MLIQQNLFRISLLFLALAIPAHAEFGTYLCSKGEKASFQLDLGDENISLTSLVGREPPLHGHVTGRTIQGFDSSGYILFENLSLYNSLFGFQESFEGNGLREGEAMVAVPTFLPGEGVLKGSIKAIWTDEEGKLNRTTYRCQRTGTAKNIGLCAFASSWKGLLNQFDTDNADTLTPNGDLSPEQVEQVKLTFGKFPNQMVHQLGFTGARLPYDSVRAIYYESMAGVEGALFDGDSSHLLARIEKSVLTHCSE